MLPASVSRGDTSVRNPLLPNITHVEKFSPIIIFSGGVIALMSQKINNFAH